MALTKKLGLLSLLTTIGLTSCSPYERFRNTDFLYTNPEEKRIPRTTKRTNTRTPPSNTPLLELGQQNIQTDTTYPFPTTTEIERNTPSDYGEDPRTEGKNPYEDRFLRPLKPYDTPSNLLVDKLMGKRERYLYGTIQSQQTMNGPFGEPLIQTLDPYQEQNIMLREVVKSTAKAAWDWFKEADNGLSKAMKTADDTVTNLTTFGSIKVEPRVSLGRGQKLDGWGLGITTKIGGWDLGASYEHREDPSTGRKDTRILLGGGITF